MTFINKRTVDGRVIAVRVGPAPEAPEGYLCSNCATTAEKCQHIFVDSGQRKWCCPSCKTRGPRALHTTKP